MFRVHYLMKENVITTCNYCTMIKLKSSDIDNFFPDYKLFDSLEKGFGGVSIISKSQMIRILKKLLTKNYQNKKK